MNNRLTANWAATSCWLVRTAFIEKCCQLPWPMVNANTMNASNTATLAAVSTFCTRATRCTPNTFRMVNAATKAQAMICAPPNRKVQSPEPNSTCAFSARREGKKYEKCSEKPSATAAMGAEKPAKKETQPVMNPQVGP